MSIKFGHVSAEDYPSVINKFSENLMQDKFIGNKCTECHNGGNLNPDFRPDKAYNSLVPTFVIAGNSTDSRLYIHLKVDKHRNVDDTSIALIKKWIDDDAENN